MGTVNLTMSLRHNKKTTIQILPACAFVQGCIGYFLVEGTDVYRIYSIFWLILNTVFICGGIF
jgi:hypothetical protein